MRRMLRSLRVLRMLLLGALACLAAMTGAQAQEWTFRVAPYAWMAGLRGDVKPFARAPTATVDLSFGDILENLDFAAFLAAEARYGDIFFRTDGSYAAISASATTPGPVFSTADLTTKTAQVSLAAGYTVYRDEAFRWDLFTGARLWWTSTDVTVNTGLLAGRNFSSEETFVDPIIGASGAWQMSPDWSLAVSGSVGGFGAAAEIEYGGTIAALWQAGEWWGLTAGYRYLAVDYDNDGFVFDVAQHGPFIGVYFDF